MSTTPNSNNATPVAENSGAIETAVAASDEVDSKTPASGKKDRFLPRVRLLLTKEYEKLLTTIVNVIEEANCAAFRSAAVDNAWADAFERLYASINDEFVRPTGKNRIHKFKSKIVDMWAMMEVEIEAGEKSATNPTYAKAMRQWSVHQSVMKNPESEGGGKSTTTPAQKQSAMANTPGATTTGAVATPATITIPSGGGAGGGNMAFSFEAGVMERLCQSVTRLERMMVLNGWAQPKLPNPLNELHYLKQQMTPVQFDASVRDTYEREIKKYLGAARHQARMSNTPAYLPGLLDGLDTLRSTTQTAPLMWTIKETYDYVLRAYMKLLDPIDAAASTPRKRKREDGATAGDEEKLDHALDEGEEDGTEDMQEDHTEGEPTEV